MMRRLVLFALVTSLAGARAHPAKTSEVLLEFDALDLDGDGKLSLVELNSAISAARPPPGNDAHPSSTAEELARGRRNCRPRHRRALEKVDSAAGSNSSSGSGADDASASGEHEEEEEGEDDTEEGEDWLEEEEGESNEFTDETVQVTIEVLIVALVLLSIGFEVGKERLVEMTPPELRMPVQHMFGELTVLGFVSLVLFCLEQAHWLEELSEYLFEDEETLEGLLESVHMFLFFLLLLFLGSICYTLRYLQSLRASLHYGEQLVHDAPRILAAYGSTRARGDDGALCATLRPVVTYLATRAHFVARVTPEFTHFDFAFYLRAGTAEFVNLIVEVTPKTWLILFVLHLPLWLAWVIGARDEASNVFIACDVLLLVAIIAWLELTALMLHRALVERVRGTWFSVQIVQDDEPHHGFSATTSPPTTAEGGRGGDGADTTAARGEQQPPSAAAADMTASVGAAARDSQRRHVDAREAAEAAADAVAIEARVPIAIANHWIDRLLLARGSGIDDAEGGAASASGTVARGAGISVMNQSADAAQRAVVRAPAALATSVTSAATSAVATVTRAASGGSFVQSTTEANCAEARLSYAKAAEASALAGARVAVVVGHPRDALSAEEVRAAARDYEAQRGWLEAWWLRQLRHEDGAKFLALVLRVSCLVIVGHMALNAELLSEFHAKARVLELSDFYSLSRRRRRRKCCGGSRWSGVVRHPWWGGDGSVGGSHQRMPRRMSHQNMPRRSLCHGMR